MIYNIKTLIVWAFSLNPRKKILIKVGLDLSIVVVSLLLAFYMRLENFNYLYKLDTYIATSIAVFVTMSVFAWRKVFVSFSRYVSIEAANSIIIGSIVSSFTLLMGILLLEIQMPRSVPFIYAITLCVLATSFSACSILRKSSVCDSAIVHARLRWHC